VKTAEGMENYVHLPKKLYDFLRNAKEYNTCAALNVVDG
tara:strand:+ start:520 stop:636 length:117 start_codon:yes stop_codon:yes gene_type:complete